MQLLTLNAAGKQLAPPQTLAPKRRRLSQVLGRHVDRSRPHMVAVQRARDPLQPIDEAWVTRGRDNAGTVKPWPRTYLPADAIVVVVYLPRGGGGSSSGQGASKGFASIAMAVAAVALIAFAGPIGAAGAAAMGLGTTAGSIISAGVVLGATALLSLASRSKANKQATDTTQVYGVAGGGNLPKPGDRIPRGYGRTWMKPDLSQPDFSQYDGDDQILFKRHTLGVGRYRPYAIRAGKQVIWREGEGFLPPFDDPRNAVECLYGTASALVPNNVVSAAGVGGMLPRPADFPASAGPFLINQRGALVSRLQVDFQFPQGISRTYTGKTTSLSNQPGEWSVVFQYAPIDATGAVVGPWQDLYSSNSGIEGARFATHPLRYTKFCDVPPGRYAVRGWNVQPDTSEHTGQGITAIDAVQWDAASGWVADNAIRPGVTELALRIYATKATGAAAFGEIEVDAGAIIPVWTGSAWVEQETSKAVWAFVDIMRNQDYGGAIPDNELDLGTALGYAQSLTEFDTFDASIRGPVSVYEAAATALLPMRAEPVHLGRYWSLVRDEPKAVRRHVISRRQILKGSTSINFALDTGSGAGHVIGEYDEGGDYRNPGQTTAIYGEASLTPTRQRWTGVRTYAHALHLSRWRAAAGAFRRETTPFSVEMEGRLYKRGDSIAVDQWFIDRRQVAGVLDYDGDTLILDAAVSIPADYGIQLRDRDGLEWGPVGCIQGNAANVVFLDPAGRAAIEAQTGRTLAQVLEADRAEIPTAIFGPVTVLRENYLIQAVKPDGRDRAAVEALIDDARVWDAIGAPVVVPPVGSSGLADPESPHIVAFTANAVQIAAGLRCDYAISPGRGAYSFEVGLSYDDGSHYETIYTGPATTGSAVLNPVDPTVVMLRARAFGVTGLPGPYFYTLLALPRPQIADALLADVIADAQAKFDELGRRADEIIADGTKTIAEAVKRLRSEVQDIAEAAATVSGGTYERNDLVKVALEGKTQEAFAAIKTEETARISAVEGVVSTATTLATRLGTAEAAIKDEETARVSADEASAEKITTLTTRLDDPVKGLEAQASATQQLTTRVVKTEDGIKSTASDVTILQSTVNNPTTGVTATAQAINGLTTEVTVNGKKTKLSAESFNALSVSYDNQNGSISQISSAIYDPEAGLQVRWGVYGVINGATGGFELVGARRNDGVVQYNMFIKGNLIVSGTITSTQLTTDQLIVNGQIFDGAVTNTQTASGTTQAEVWLQSRNASSKFQVIVFRRGRGGMKLKDTGGAGNLQILFAGSRASAFNVYDAVVNPINWLWSPQFSASFQQWLAGSLMVTIQPGYTGEVGFQVRDTANAPDEFNVQRVADGVYISVTELSK